MNTLTIDLPTEQYEQLNQIATRRGTSPEELVRDFATECLSRDEAIEVATRELLKKNAELYRRLAK